MVNADFIYSLTPEEVVERFDIQPSESFKTMYQDENIRPLLRPTHIYKSLPIVQKHGEVAYLAIRNMVNKSPSFRDAFMKAVYEKPTEKIYPLEDFLV